MTGRSPIWLLAAGLVAIGFAAWTAAPWRVTLRETAIDALLSAAAPAALADVVVVDIDRATLARHGTWPIPRQLLADIVERVGRSGARAIAIDILFDARLDEAGLAGRVDPLAASLQAVPTVLGFMLDPDQTAGHLPTPALLMRGEVPAAGAWRTRGYVGPASTLSEAAEGLGTMAVAADADGQVRHVPVIVSAGGLVRPGLSLELVRLGREAGATILDPEAGSITMGDIVRPLSPDGQLRLRMAPPAAWQGWTVSAAELLAGGGGERLRGKLVIVGSSAPEAGGLRVSPVSATTPSVQIQAMAAQTLLTGPVLIRPAWADTAETAGAVVLVVLAGLAGLSLRPVFAVSAAIGLAMAWVLAVAIGLFRLDLAVDPAGPAAASLAGFAILGLARLTETERQARLLRDRFEQRLPAAVVRQIARAPELLRLGGEERDITALFTDIEGFTAMCERSTPAEIVAVLDEYLDVMNRIIVAHGGMVEKVVGDSIHSIFNAPLDLPDHTHRAADCAVALIAAAEAYALKPLPARLGFGRTRIGIESGPAVVGDVGGGTKLDYTAHGMVMNKAARLEQANKGFGTSVCIGPVAAERLDPARLVPLGAVDARGVTGGLSVCTLRELARPVPGATADPAA